MELEIRLPRDGIRMRSYGVSRRTRRVPLN
jgi:hypothetical protein